jgi:hypoxia up-regulated 1
MEVEIGNIEEAIGNLTELGTSDPVVKATITLSESGFILMPDAIAFSDIKDDTITGEWFWFFSLMFHESQLPFVGKLKGFFGGGSSSSDETIESAENVPPCNSEMVSTSSAAPSSSGTSSGNGNTSPSTTPEKKVTPVENIIPLTIDVRFTSIPPLTVSKKKVLRNRYV